MEITPAIQEKIREVAKGFEAGFLRQMIDAMERAQLDEGFFGSSAGSKTRQTTFQLLLSDALAQDGSLGLADQITEELTKDISKLSGEKTTAPSPDLFNIFRWEAQEVPAEAEESGG